MRMTASLILAALLAVMAYGIFWLVCLAYTTDQMKDAVAQGLGAEMTYGRPVWVPDPNEVTMDLPLARITIAKGPVREMTASSLRLSSGFLMRDRWRMSLPGRVDVTLANGRKLVLDTVKGEVLWQSREGSLSFRADKLRVMDEQGQDVAVFDEVMLKRKPSDHGVRINLASRPRWNGVDGILSGEVILPPGAFATALNMFGGPTPGLGDIFLGVVNSLQAGGSGANTIKFENVSFKFGQGGSGAISGDMGVMTDGRMIGKVSLTADNRDLVMGWVQKSGVINPRTEAENAGVVRFYRSMPVKYPAVTLENMQQTLTLNGNPVGALPVARNVVKKLWP